ncbi:ABC-type transport auxiliary lipoprotein family protein [Pigmentiphaga sp.]|uniref:ABC-type transport auxiliary lipoprotein family protein n=1 Tax=Pigmentiphaga sp. TaxID=1977564 RepID=UPI0025E85604|nr:ABC-type transport auxiliary lipoprotein family protein [Pigmentiphaga sp.]MBX6317736.1 membrane integrity-associated transporter subunit PqiC [Pigmentiphaga sp.]
MIPVRRAGRLAAIAALSWIAACSVLPERRAVDVYRLPSALTPPPASTNGRGTLRVTMPNTTYRLENPRIAVIAEANRISSYAGARWADIPPVMMRDRLTEALRANGRFQNVTTSDSNVQAELELDTDLRAFHSEYRGGEPYAVIALQAHLVAPASRRIVASRAFEVSERSDGTGVPFVVDAFGRAADAVARQVADWAAAQERPAEPAVPLR